MRPLSLFILFFAITNFSCEEKKPEPWSAFNYKRITDSLNIENIIAIYEESGSLLILEFDPTQKQLARKLTYRKEFPLYLDTLSYVKPNEFRSKKEDITYLIKDTCVVTIQYVKIFHPNSNLRGQTPWTQPYVNTYKRLDK